MLMTRFNAEPNHEFDTGVDKWWVGNVNGSNKFTGFYKYLNSSLDIYLLFSDIWTLKYVAKTGSTIVSALRLTITPYVVAYSGFYKVC